MPKAQRSTPLSAVLLGLLLASCSGNAEPARAPAPTASDQISMTRGPCFGACPMYTVTVTGDGRVVYEGDRFVAVTGERTKTVDPAIVAALFAQADSIRFFDLPADITPGNVAACGNAPTDMPGAEIAILWADRDHTVRHYHGCPKAPEGLTAFENRIDAALGLGEWVGRR